MKTILASPDLLKIEKISFCSNEVRLAVKIRLLKSTCLPCGWQSDKGVISVEWRGFGITNVYRLTYKGHEHRSHGQIHKNGSGPL